jgi:hypothetical protein
MTAVALAVAALFLIVRAPEADATLDSRAQITGLEVIGDEPGWSPERVFRLEWKSPPVSVRAVNYEVRDDVGEVVSSGRLNHASSVLQDVEVPGAPGAYTATVWLETDLGEGPPANTELYFDDEPPATVAISGPGGWLRRDSVVVLEIEHPAAPWPQAGIRGYAFAIAPQDGVTPCAGPNRCTIAETDLGGGVDDDSVSLTHLDEGLWTARGYAVSGSGMRSPQPGSLELKVDGTPPTVAVSGAAEGWSNESIRVSAVAADSLSGMEQAGSTGPFTELEVDGRPSRSADGGAVTTLVHGEGVHSVVARARDAAGNLSGATAPALVRIDETAPSVTFSAAQDPTEPERIEAVIEDGLSGPSATHGSISFRRLGAKGRFSQLSTSRLGNRLLATWPSDDFPPGAYEFRAEAFDAAGNRNSSGDRIGGAAMILTNPLKAETALAFGFGSRTSIWPKCRRVDGHLRCHAVRIDPYARRPRSRTVGYGPRIPVGGRLTTGGAPLAGLPVEVLETSASGAISPTRTTIVRTAADGTFLAHLPKGPSRQIEILFAGTPTLTRAEGSELRLSVRSAIHLRASTRVVTIGGAPVVFSGTLGTDGATISLTGRTVELQFRLAGEPWHEFRSLRTGPSGHFRYAYSFSDDDSRGARFQFRAVVPAQSDWPYAPGNSLPVFVAGR